MEQNIRLDVNHMMADMLGGEYGVTQAQLAAMQDAAMKAQHAVEANRGTGWLGWMNLPYNQEEIVSEIEKVAEHVRKTFKYLSLIHIYRNWTPEERLELVSQVMSGKSCVSVAIEAGIQDRLLYYEKSVDILFDGTFLKKLCEYLGRLFHVIALNLADCLILFLPFL